MILPTGFESMTEEELVQKLINDVGYDLSAAEWISGMVKGRVIPDSPIM